MSYDLESIWIIYCGKFHCKVEFQLLDLLGFMSLKLQPPISSLTSRKKSSGVPPCIISGTNGHLSRTTDVLQANWIALSHECIQSP
jgi:hypothetical protein